MRSRQDPPGAAEGVSSPEGLEPKPEPVTAAEKLSTAKFAGRLSRSDTAPAPSPARSLGTGTRRHTRSVRLWCRTKSIGKIALPPQG
jgi:hypothetical protein